MHHLRLLIFLFYTACTLNAYADTPTGKEHEVKTPKAFSYFAVGVEHVNYRERIDAFGGTIETGTTTENVVLLSGGRTFINHRWSFSINATSTLYPNRTTEKWKITRTMDIPVDTTGDGSADSTSQFEPQRLQSNSFTYSQTATQILAHYHPYQWWSIDGGATYSLGTFKRFSFAAESVLAQSLGDTVVEETFAELTVHGGGSIMLPITPKFRFRLASQLGMPVMSRIENTRHPDMVFDSTTGWQAELTSSLVYHFNENINVGLVYDFQYQLKDKQSQVDSDSGARVYIPENIRMSHRYGIITSWAF